MKTWAGVINVFWRLRNDGLVSGFFNEVSVSLGWVRVRVRFRFGFCVRLWVWVRVRV